MRHQGVRPARGERERERELMVLRVKERIYTWEKSENVNKYDVVLFVYFF